MDDRLMRRMDMDRPDKLDTDFLNNTRLRPRPLYLLYRAFVALWGVFFIAYSWAQISPAWYFSAYLSFWSLVLLAIYLLLAFAALIEVMCKTGGNRNGKCCLSSRCFGTFMLFFHESVVILAIMVAVLYWFLVFPHLTTRTAQDYFININIHGVNGIIVLIEFFITDFAWVWWHAIVTTAIAVVYGIVNALIVHYRKSRPYNVISWEDENSFIIFGAAIAAALVIHLLFTWISRCRSAIRDCFTCCGCFCLCCYQDDARYSPDPESPSSAGGSPLSKRSNQQEMGSFGSQPPQYGQQSAYGSQPYRG